MKTSNKELRAIKADGSLLCAELLQSRREVRRLRKALLESRRICDSSNGTWVELGEVLDAALKPKRGRK